MQKHTTMQGQKMLTDARNVNDILLQFGIPLLVQKFFPPGDIKVAERWADQILTIYGKNKNYSKTGECGNIIILS